MKVLICTFGNPYHYACRIFYALLQDIAEVKLFFFNGKWNSDTKNFINKYINSDKPDLVAVSLLTFEFDLCKKFVATVRRLCASDETKIIFGGPHAFLATEDCLSVADFVCKGEGEYTILELCRQFKRSGKWASVELKLVPNLFYHSGDTVGKSDIQNLYYSRPFIDDLPFPAYGESGIYTYDGIAWQRDISVENNFYYAFSSRGCPFACSYCINASYKSRKVTLRSPWKVIEELILIKNKFPHLTNIHFVDEVFCWQRKWVQEFCKLYTKYVSLPFECESFPGRHSEEIIQLLARAGLIRVHIGVQSCSRRVLDEIFNRPQRIQDILNDNKIYISNGILPTYDFIVDNPFEKTSELLETVEIARQLKRPNFFRIYSLFFFPHHQLTIRAEQEGLCNPEDRNHRFYDKITTTHLGDQYSKKTWYIKPLRAISGGDEKATLNWLLTCYGDPAIPKPIVDFVFYKYRQGELYWILVLAYYYRLRDFFYKNKWRCCIIAQIYRQHGIWKSSLYIFRKLGFKKYLFSWQQATLS